MRIEDQSEVHKRSLKESQPQVACVHPRMMSMFLPLAGLLTSKESVAHIFRHFRGGLLWALYYHYHLIVQKEGGTAKEF